MNRPSDPTFDQRLADWLEDDPSTAPREVLATVLAAYPSIDQRRRSRAPWRFPTMNPITRMAMVAAALAVAIGAAYLLFRPATHVGPPASSAPPTIEGTWDVDYSRQEMLAASPDPSEDDPSNYGHFHLTFLAGQWAMVQLAPQQSVASATYTDDGGVVHIFSAVDNVTFDLTYSVSSTTLTFGPGGPVGLRVKPWTRVATEPIPSVGPTASAATQATIGQADIGKALRAGRYQVSGFAQPFAVTLPDGWTLKELTPTSASMASSSDASINVFMAVVHDVYRDPCHPDASPKPVASGVDALVTALSATGGLTVTGIQAVTVGGATGKTFTLKNAIADATVASCKANPMPFVTHVVDGADVQVPMFAGETDQLWIVDAGGTTVLIAVTDNRVDTLRPILDSLSFGG